MPQLYQLLCSFYFKKYDKMLIFYIEWGTQVFSITFHDFLIFEIFMTVRTERQQNSHIAKSVGYKEIQRKTYSL